MRNFMIRNKPMRNFYMWYLVMMTQIRELAIQNASIKSQSRTYWIRIFERTLWWPPNQQSRNLRKKTRMQQIAEIALDTIIKLEPNSQQSDSIDPTDHIEQTPNSGSSSQQTQSVSKKTFKKGKIKTIQEQIGKNLQVDMSKWKQFSYTDRAGINQGATKYRWTKNQIPIKIQQCKPYIKKCEQYCDAITALSASQSTELITFAKAFETKSKADECIHIFKLSTIGANAVTQLRKGIKLPYQFRVVARNNMQPSDIITENTMERIKRYIEQKNLEYQAAAMAMQYGTQHLPQLFNPNPIPYLAPSYLYNNTQQYCNQQSGGFPRREREIQGIQIG
ncbi:MAG: hypothetical protein EZS28_001418 [Streblomastix strix]|uniref:Uncharacterized protein n=1 Tax=Streblomastix strix TaxID=222440 RepID=A0A5J4X748_9EUKA|nr:MAG: hypothetical protein EZS28_001418 [Streblomastix strix]